MTPQGPSEAQGQWRDGKSADKGGHRDGAEAAHEACTRTGLRDGAEIGGVAGDEVGKGDGDCLKGGGGGGPCTATSRGMQEHGGGAAIIIQRGADLFDAPEVRDGHIGLALAFTGNALVAAGPQTKITKERSNIFIRIEPLSIHACIRKPHHQ